MTKKEVTTEELFGKIEPTSPEFQLLDTLDIFLGSLEKQYSLGEDELNIVDGELTLFIIKSSTEDALVRNLMQHLSLTLDKNKVDEIVKKSKDFFKNSNPNKPKEAPSPIQALASIKERLSQASTIAPTKRDYSVDKSAPVQDGVKPKIDPYRELPEK